MSKERAEKIDFSADTMTLQEWIEDMRDVEDRIIGTVPLMTIDPMLDALQAFGEVLDEVRREGGYMGGKAKRVLSAHNWSRRISVSREEEE